MKIKDETAFKEEVLHTIGLFLGFDYAERICDSIIEDVQEDVEACADEEYNSSDIILAIGRALHKKLVPNV